MSCCETLIAAVGNNSIGTDAASQEAQLRQNHPRLLMDDEKVLLSFKGRGGIGRNDHFFTTKRILFKDVRFVTGKCVNFLSIPYFSIKAYSVDTAGMLDTDCTLQIWAESTGFTSMDFVAGKVDMFEIMRFLNDMVLVDGATGTAQAKALATMPEPPDAGAVDKMLGFLGDDAHQIDAGKLEQVLKTDPHILLADETVEMAFKAGRDSFVLTSKRVLRIDVQGLSGKRIEYTSILWRHVKMFSVETAGSFDTDATLILFTDICGMGRIEQDLRKGKVDVMAVQKFFSDKILGMDATTFSGNAVTNAGVQDQGSGSLFAWMGDDSRMVDAAQLNAQYHSSPPILQGSEMVEMAFKGRRDLVMFTTKRLLFVDMKGFTGQKVNYISVPWTTVQCFGVRSAGSWMDKDSEMFIWTNVDDIYYPPKQGDDPPPPPQPRMSYLEQDFQKDKVDLMAIHRYLSERCLRTQAGGYMPPEVGVNPAIFQSTPEGGVEGFLNWIGDDARFIPAAELDQQLHTVNPMLQADEHVGMACKSGRDMLIFTTKRVLVVDVQGWTGKKVEYKSIPYTSLRAFSVETAGSWDRDAEVKLFCKTYWINDGPSNVFAQDLRKGKCDIIAMQSYLAAQILGAQDGSATLPPPMNAESPEPPGGAQGAMQWLGGDAHEIKAETVNQQLHTNPPILQSDETVEKAYKCGRDMTVFTTKRILYVDVQGWTGQKVEYMSYPLHFAQGFAVQSAGTIAMFHGANASVFLDCPGSNKVTQDLSKSNADIWDVQEHFMKKILR